MNGAVARAAVDAAPHDVRLTLHDISDITLFNGDVEAAGAPPAVVALHEAVARADGLVLFSPEYNGSFPAVTKNVIDWLSRPPKSWEGTPITMVSATPGPRAGLGVRDHFTAIMTYQPVRLFETFGIGSYAEKLDDTGAVNDSATIAELAAFLERFADFCRTGPDDS